MSRLPSSLHSGDVLLSHGLSPYYHRGCSVSLPCSEWERVGPLRYCHQSPMPDWRYRCFAARQADAGLWRRRPRRRTPYNFPPRSATAATAFSKEHDFQSAIANRKSAISSGSLISTYRFSENSAVSDRGYNRLSFVLRSFVSSVCRRLLARATG